jgi:hypothetical protein
MHDLSLDNEFTSEPSTPVDVSEKITNNHVHGVRLILVVVAMILALFLIFLDEVSPSSCYLYQKLRLTI